MLRSNPRLFFAWWFDFPMHFPSVGYGMAMWVVWIHQFGWTSTVFLVPLVWSPRLVTLVRSCPLVPATHFQAVHPCRGLHRFRSHVVAAVIRVR